MHTNIISGHLLATSYWHVTAASDTGDNVTRVMKAAVVEGSGSDPEGGAPDRSPTLASVPLVPSNSPRGRLRRETLGILTEALLARNVTLSRDAYQMLSNGGLVGSSKDGNVAPSVGEVLRARRNLHFGLWGGGPRLMHSSVVTSDLMPVCAETVAAGRVPSRLKGFAPTRMTRVQGGEYQPSPARGNDLLQVRMFKRNDDAMQLNAQAIDRLKVLGGDSEEIIAAYQAEQLGFREARKEAKAATDGKGKGELTKDEEAALKKRDVINFLEIEAIVPGTVWPVDFRLAADATPAQIALFCRGLERFVKRQNMGGMGRWGFGQYRAYLSIDGADGPIGTLRWSDEVQNHVLTFVNDSYDKALADALATFDPAEIDGFVAVNKADDKAPKAKRSGKKAGEAEGAAVAESEA